MHNFNSTSHVEYCIDIKLARRDQDLISIERVWGLSRAITQNGKQYFSVKEMKLAIENMWFEIKPQAIHNLVLWMKKKCSDN